MSTPTTPTWETLSLDQTMASRHAAGRLVGEFDGIFGVETIERSCTPRTTSSPAGPRSASPCR